MHSSSMFRRAAVHATASQAVSPTLSSPSRRTLTDPTGFQSARPEPLGHLDAMWMATAVVWTFVLSYVLSHGRILWEDELLSFMLIHDPSWRHMVHAWRLGADGRGFTFYLTARGWCAAFGYSAASLRFYSAAGFAGAFCLLWATARRFYGVWTTAVALFAFWFFNAVLVVHMAEGRFYGLLMLGSALAVWLLARASATRNAPVSLCVAMFLVHAFLSTSHMLGFIYSANLLAALCLMDWWNGNKRLPLYLSGAAAWLLLFPERAAITSSAAVGKPHFWTAPPDLHNFLLAYTGFSMLIAGLGGVLAVFALFGVVRQEKRWRRTLADGFRKRRAVYAVAAAIFAIPIEIVMESRIGPSLLLDRYLMPLAIAQALVAAEAIALTNWPSVLPRAIQNGRVFKVAFVAVFAAALFLRDFRGLEAHAVSPVDYTQEITNRLPHNLPVLCEDALMFTELIGKQHASGVHYMYLLDWPQSIRSGAPRPEVTQYHLMENWKKAGYFSDSIEQRDLFLKQYPRFIVLGAGYGLEQGFSSRASRNPLAERFAEDPAYQVLPYGKKGATGRQDTWLVCRGRC